MQSHERFLCCAGVPSEYVPGFVFCISNGVRPAQAEVDELLTSKAWSTLNVEQAVPNCSKTMNPVEVRLLHVWTELPPSEHSMRISGFGPGFQTLLSWDLSTSPRQTQVLNILHVGAADTRACRAEWAEN